MFGPDSDLDESENEIVGNDSDEPLTEKVIENPPSYGELLTRFKENIFKFILKCREKNHLPVSVQEKIVDDVNFFCFFKENYNSFIAYHMQKKVVLISQRNGKCHKF